MELLLRDKVVLITGASGGIGRALAETFGEVGARLVLHGSSRLDELTAWVGDRPWRARAVALGADLTSPAEVDALFAAALERFGRVDVCLANAGIWPAEDRRLDQISEERLRRTVEVDLLGPMWTARAFMRQLAGAGPRPDGHGACLIFTGSTAGRFGEAGHADYAASKAGLLGLMLSLKNEIVRIDPYGRVHLIEPGWTVTSMTRKSVDEPGVVERIVRTMPLRQIARAEDVARAALFLASPALARHVSGQTLTVAGGMEGRVLWDPQDVDRERVLARLDPDPS
jgi:3-oxoacyl-[acyl-carrier protein] reductase